MLLRGTSDQYAGVRVNSFTIFLLSLFYYRQNLCQLNRQLFRRTSWWSRYVPFFVWCLFKEQEAVKCLSSLHDRYVIVPADKASNNIVFVCKSYYFECLIKELGINNNTSSNTTYKPTTWEKDLDFRLSKRSLEFFKIHMWFMPLRE
jgi:hypothetical protein